MKYAKILLIIALIAVLLFFFLKNVSFKEVYNIISSVNLVYPIVFLLGLYAQFYVRAYRWGLILKTHKDNIPLFTLYSYTVIGFFLSSLIPGKVGEPAKGILLAGEEKISRSYGLASVVLERLIDMLMMFLLFIISLFFIDDSISPLLVKLKTIAYFALPVLLFILILFFLLNTGKVFNYVERIIRLFARVLPVRLRERATAFALNFVKGLRLDLSFFGFVKLFFASLMVWLFLIPFYWFLMKGFDFGADITLFETIPYFCVIVASAAIPTPGMAGSFDAASRLGLEELCGAATNPAAAYTILAHFLILMVMVIPGSVAAWRKGISMQTIKEIKNSKEKKEQ
jgi:uncharacterized protein (TIRG00374 family)